MASGFGWRRWTKNTWHWTFAFLPTAATIPIDTNHRLYLIYHGLNGGSKTAVPDHYYKCPFKVLAARVSPQSTLPRASINTSPSSSPSSSPSLPISFTACLYGVPRLDFFSTCPQQATTSLLQIGFGEHKKIRQSVVCLNKKSDKMLFV
jgi:hypothetical protein